LNNKGTKVLPAETHFNLLKNARGGRTHPLRFLVSVPPETEKSPLPTARTFLAMLQGATSGGKRSGTKISHVKERSAESVPAARAARIV